ncbi:MAG: hypothetical protein QXG65_03140 [Thermoplasmata archaeon]
MAKKVRAKAEAHAAEPAFEFPVFDERSFVEKEYEITLGMAIAGLLALGVGIASWAVTSSGLPWPISVVLGFASMIGLYPLVQAAHPRSHVYTRGDWAALVAVVFFGWLAVWFLFSDVWPHLA